MMQPLTPTKLAGLDRPTIIDVREFPEFAGGAIPGASCVPLAALAKQCSAWDQQSQLVLACRSGKRSQQAAELLAGKGFSDLAFLEGGTEAWIAAGMPVSRLEARPWSIERQVRTMAGAMVAISTLLGILVSPWFFAWTLAVGSGLVVAGVTDSCLMGTLLGKMPWNCTLDRGR